MVERRAADFRRVFGSRCWQTAASESPSSTELKLLDWDFVVRFRSEPNALKRNAKWVRTALSAGRRESA